jgi:hypothetical protein
LKVLLWNEGQPKSIQFHIRCCNPPFDPEARRFIMQKTLKLVHLCVLALVLLSACNLPTSGNTAQATSSSAGLVQTAAAQTVEALQTQLAATSPASEVPTQMESSPTLAMPTAAVQTMTPAPLVVIPTLTPTPQPKPCDRAAFVTDVTVPDDTNFAAGTSFTKTWRLQNNGTCTWTSSYKLVFVSGDAMEGPASVALPGNVPPGQTVDVSVNLKAPSTAKKYQGDWQLQNASGTNFGVGLGANKTFWVKIVVGGTNSSTAVPYFAVTKVVTTASVASSSTCPKIVTFSAAITVSQAGTVTYTWRRSDGAESPVANVVFDAAGTKNVTTTWELGAAGDGAVTGSEQVYVDNPNHQAFGKATFTFNCP